MKAKTKKIVTKKAKRAAKPAKRSVKYVHAKKRFLCHFRLIENKHSFKLVHFRHTSHVTLFIVLLLLGFLLFAGSQAVKSFTSSGLVTIGARVSGSPPTMGATITEPANGEQVSQAELRITGVCQANTFVVVRDNDLTAGSTNCTSAGIFSLLVQLQVGLNVLSALNYDNANQFGPETPTITVRYNALQDSIIEINSAPTIPINPSIIPDLVADKSECENYKSTEALPTGGPPHVSIVCVPRLFLPKIEQTMGIIAWGGNPPYAINIDWGDKTAETTLLSIAEPGYKTVKFNYEQPGNYDIFLRLTDKSHQAAIVQSATVVSGVVETNNPISSITADIVNNSWFQASVPLYLLAVAITVGFWCGDIFQRLAGN